MTKIGDLEERDKLSNLHLIEPKAPDQLSGSERPLKSLVQSAEDGAREAAYQLGCMYLAGIGVEKDPPTAGEWYRKAACAGFDKAQFSLGLLLISGDGIGQNYDEALGWLSLAAKGSNPALSQECRPYILLLSLAIGPERTGAAVRGARQLLSPKE
jgi:TPR repeat protein